MEVDIASLEEGKESAYFLVVGDMFDKGDEGIPHGQVMGIGFMNEANRRLGVNSAV